MAYAFFLFSFVCVVGGGGAPFGVRISHVDFLKRLGNNSVLLSPC